MIIHSDWHIHSENSYDASNPITAIGDQANAQGMRYFGITDHANYNDDKFRKNIEDSAKNVKQLQAKYPNMVLGVELTPIEKPCYDYICEHGTRDGYSPPAREDFHDFLLPYTKEELTALGMRFAITAVHWSLIGPNARGGSIEKCIESWHCQQMALACDERTTILGHPWYCGKALWYEDFSIIPHTMNLELGAALKENGKYVECNSHFFTRAKTTEKFRHQYAEFLRELFEMGIPVTYGSDSHHSYEDLRPKVEEYLSAAGFADGDFSELSEKDLW